VSFCSGLIGFSQTTLPDLPVKDASGIQRILTEELDEGINYLLPICASWEGFSKRQLVQWESCYLEWNEMYNLKLVALMAINTVSSDSFERVLKYYKDEMFPYRVYFVEQDSLNKYIPIPAYPTNIFVNDMFEIVDTTGPLRNCGDALEIIETHFLSVGLREHYPDRVADYISVINNNVVINTGRSGIDIRLFSIDGSLIVASSDCMSGESISIPDNLPLFVAHIIDGKAYHASILYNPND